jgi:hypothetical protein
VHQARSIQDVIGGVLHHCCIGDAAAPLLAIEVEHAVRVVRLAAPLEIALFLVADFLRPLVKTLSPCEVDLALPPPLDMAVIA